MAVGDFQDYSDPRKNNFTRTFGLSKPRYASKKTSLGGTSIPLQGGGFDYTSNTPSVVLGQNSIIGNSTPTSTYAPTGLSISDITSNPSMYANSDFSNYSTGALGTNPTISDITSNPEFYANYDFSGMGAGSLGVDAPASTPWVDGMSNYETMHGAAGLGGLAMNAYGMFGDGGTMDVNKKNIELMDQQLLNNREEMANRKGYRADIARTFAPKTGLGA